MLLEKNAIGMEDAINILESHGLKPSIRQLGNQKTLITKFVDGYSLLVKDDESCPGYLCACFNSSERGVITTWNEINYKSLNLAINYVQEYLEINFKRKLFDKPLHLIATVIFIASLGFASYLLASNFAQCKTQQSEQLLNQP